MSTGVLVTVIVVLLLLLAAATGLFWRLYTDGNRRVEMALNMLEAERRRAAEQQAALRAYG